MKNHFGRLIRGIVKDGFMSAFTGQGTRADKAKSYRFHPTAIPSQRLDELYSYDEFVPKIIDLLPNAAVSKWIDINHEKSKEILDALAKLNTGPFPGLKRLVTKFDKMSRLHGGAAIFWDVDDGLTVDQPINPYRVKSFNGGKVFYPPYIYPSDNLAGVDSELWDLYSMDLKPMQKVHISRLSLDHSVDCSDWMLRTNRFWPIPMMNRIYAVMLALNTSLLKIPTILEDFITKVYSAEGLNGMMQSEDDKEWQQKITAQFDATSLINVWVQDTKDKFEKITSNVTGLPDLILVMERAFSAVCDTPYGKIFGQYQGSALSTGSQTEDSDWDCKIAEHQEHHTRPPIQRALEFQSLVMGISEPIQFDFPPQEEESRQDQAQLHLTQAQADAIAIDKGILFPEEVSQSRYGGDSYSTQTQLDPKLRAKKDKEKAIMQAKLPVSQTQPPQMPMPSPQATMPIVTPMRGMPPNA